MSVTTPHHLVIFMVSALFILSASVHIPAGGSLRHNTDSESQKSNAPGEEVTFNISVSNDNFYPIDIKAEIAESLWNTTLEVTEVSWISPGEKVIIPVIVRIPEEPVATSSDTKIRLYERPSTNGRTGYELELFVVLNTTVSGSGQTIHRTGGWGGVPSNFNDWPLPVLVCVIGLIIIPLMFKRRRDLST